MLYQLGNPGAHFYAMPVRLTARCYCVFDWLGTLPDNMWYARVGDLACRRAEAPNRLPLPSQTRVKLLLQGCCSLHWSARQRAYERFFRGFKLFLLSRPVTTVA